MQFYGFVSGVLRNCPGAIWQTAMAVKRSYVEKEHATLC